MGTRNWRKDKEKKTSKEKERARAKDTCQIKKAVEMNELMRDDGHLD